MHNTGRMETTATLRARNLFERILTYLHPRPQKRGGWVPEAVAEGRGGIGGLAPRAITNARAQGQRVSWHHTLHPQHQTLHPITPYTPDITPSPQKDGGVEGS